MLNGNFNFFNAAGQQIGNTIYDPTTIRQNADGAWISDPFPGNVIPKDRFDAVANNFLSHNPVHARQHDAGICRQAGPASEPRRAHEIPFLSARASTSSSTTSSIRTTRSFARYSQAHHTSYRDRWTNELNWQLLDRNAIPFPIDQPNIVVSDTYTISPTVINEFRVGFNRRKTTQDPVWRQRQIGRRQLGIPGVNGVSFPYFVGLPPADSIYRMNPGGISFGSMGRHAALRRT